VNESSESSTVVWRLSQLEKAVVNLETHMDRLGSKLDRLFMALVGASLTVAVSVIVFAVTFVSGKP
jgi:hypothetical protein